MDNSKEGSAKLVKQFVSVLDFGDVEPINDIKVARVKSFLVVIAAGTSKLSQLAGSNLEDLFANYRK